MKIEEADALIYQYQGREILKAGVDTARIRHEVRVPYYRARLGAFLPQDKGAKMIDLPCGDGNLLYFLRALGYQDVTGWDLDESRVQVANELGLNAQAGDAMAVMNDVTDVDTILTADFVEHIEKSDVFDFLRICRHALKENGTLIIRTPVTDSVFGVLHMCNDYTHRWSTNSSVWNTIAGAAGYQLTATLDERPLVFNLKTLVLRILFEMARLPLALLFRMLGPWGAKVWSPSVWLVLRKV
ncbi:class I SAM-dependent methyltransferase [Coraliomargarita sp. W4R72]